MLINLKLIIYGLILIKYFDVQNDTSCNVAEERTKQVSPGRSFTNNISQPSQNPREKVSLRSPKNLPRLVNLPQP